MWITPSLAGVEDAVQVPALPCWCGAKECGNREAHPGGSVMKRAPLLSSRALAPVFFLGACHVTPAPSPIRPAATSPVTAPRPPQRCQSRADCPDERSYCVEIDRRGRLRFEGARAPTRRYCVSRCVDGACPSGERCAPIPGTEVVTRGGLQHLRSRSEALCVPLPRYGSMRQGAHCFADGDCARESPYCVHYTCARRCGPDCPDGFSCVSVQFLGEGVLVSVAFCLPRIGSAGRTRPEPTAPPTPPPRRGSPGGSP
jgi:hypothetical protein